MNSLLHTSRLTPHASRLTHYVSRPPHPASRNTDHTNSGFSLLEILVVVMIMTILATIVGINFAKEPGRARVAKATAQIGVFRNALQLYRMDNGQYPTMQQGLKAMCEKPQVHPLPTKYREGGYIESRRVPLDPWSNEYVYLVPGPEGGPFEIVSYGADGEPGGEGESSDVRSSDM